MSVEGDLFRVTVKGSRESIIKMMNAALKSFNSDNVIEDSDDAKTMNSKLEMFAGEEGKDIGIPDLLGQGKEGDADQASKGRGQSIVGQKAADECLSGATECGNVSYAADAPCNGEEDKGSRKTAQHRHVDVVHRLDELLEGKRAGVIGEKHIA